MTSLATTVAPGAATGAAERPVLDAIPVAVYAADLDGRITLVNRAWSRFAQAGGAPQLADDSAVLGMPIADAIADIAPREHVEHAMATLRTGRAQSVAWEVPCASSEEARVFLMQVSALREGHAVTGFVFSTVDITASHRSREVLIDTGLALARTVSADRAVQEVASQLRRIPGCDGIAIALADVDPAALRLAHNQGFEAGAPPQDSEGLARALRPAWTEALRRGGVVARDATGGLELTAPMTGSATGDASNVVGAITLHFEGLESPQRVAEARRVLATIAAATAATIERVGLAERDEQKRRLEAVGEVAAGVAHELRNPLFGISSAAQLLRFRIREDPVVEKNVGRILREVERLNSMVTALLEYGRPTPARLRPGDPDAVWDDVLELQRGRLESKALGLARWRATPPARCAVDGEQLAQVFTNVLVNAIDAAPEGSDLALTSVTLPGGVWRCRLHNGGPAIPSDVLPHVFELFFSTKPGGTGIGLALCQRIVEEHGGTITLESTEERGTTAAVTLPAN
ncbi:MAG: ATP-binding protein [Gemmatimonadota bacterium]|nr:ATP-binding protein [Gemmatimonadota bacterium]